MAKLFSAILFLLALMPFPLAQQQNKTAFGPVVTAYFTNLTEELNELEFQIQHQEISRNDYTRSKQRLLLQKQYVERHAIISGEDTIIDLQILTTEEIATMFGAGEVKSQSLRVGDVLGGKWQISSIEKRGERFFILERNAKESARQSRPKINPIDIIETIRVYEPDPEEVAQAQAAKARPAEPPALAAQRGHGSAGGTLAAGGRGDGAGRRRARTRRSERRQSDLGCGAHTRWSRGDRRGSAC